MRPWHSPALAEISSYETRASPRIVWIMYVVMYSPRPPRPAGGPPRSGPPFKGPPGKGGPGGGKKPRKANG